jgi:predicted RNA-binding protein with PIN domain
MYLIDGHNLIGSGLIPGLDLSQADDEQRLAAFLRGQQPLLRQPITVVFDGGLPGGQALELSGSGVTVIFAAQDRTDADSLIRARVRKHKMPSEVIVVSNDGQLCREVQALGAGVLSAAAFLQRLANPRRRPAPRQARPQTEPKLPKSEVTAWLREFGVIPPREPKP